MPFQRLPATSASGLSAVSWWTPTLADGTQADPNSLLQSALTQAAGGEITYSVSGGAGYTNPRDGATVTWPIQDIFGDALAGFPLSLHLGLEVVGSPPSNSSGVVIVAGFVNGTDISTNKLLWGGIDWDLANPRPKAGEDGSQSNGSANVGIVSVVTDYESLPSLAVAQQRFTFTIRSGCMNSTDLRLQMVSRTVSEEMSGVNPLFFISVYGSGAIAGTETFAIKPRVIAPTFPGSWTP